MKYFVAGIFAIVFAVSSEVAFTADDTHDVAGHKKLALSLSTGEEESERGGKHSANAIGLEFEYRLNQEWGIGGAVEYLKVHGKNNTVIVVPVSYFFGDGFRAFAGPGYEFKAIERNDKPIFRVGLGYSFQINEKWSISPEAINDFVGGGHNMWLLGVAIGYGF